MKKIATLLIVLAVFSARGQNDKPERSGFILRVPRNAKQTYIQQVNPGPYFAEKSTLQLYPYEKVYVEVELKSDTIFAMKTVQTNVHPDRTLEIEFCQNVEQNTARPTQLWVKNPFARPIRYTALLYSIEDSAWRESNHVLRARWSSDVIWKKEIVGSLVLKDWRLE